MFDILDNVVCPCGEKMRIAAIEPSDVSADDSIVTFTCDNCRRGLAESAGVEPARPVKVSSR